MLIKLGSNQVPTQNLKNYGDTKNDLCNPE